MGERKNQGSSPKKDPVHSIQRKSKKKKKGKKKRGKCGDEISTEPQPSPASLPSPQLSPVSAVSTPDLSSNAKDVDGNTNCANHVTHDDLRWGSQDLFETTTDEATPTVVPSGQKTVSTSHEDSQSTDLAAKSSESLERSCDTPDISTATAAVTGSTNTQDGVRARGEY